MATGFFLRTAVALGLAVVSPARPAEGQQRAERMDRWLARYHDFDQFNGVVLVAEQGRPIYSRGFGYANFEWSVANAPDTRFRIGSINKQFTAALILRLHEQGRLDPEAPITRYLPGYPSNPGDRITVHHLLTHSSGIPEYFQLADFGEFSREALTTGEVIDLFSGLPLDFEPGTELSYSNSGYYLLGAIVEEITGEDYEAVLQRELLEPLGLHDTGLEARAEVVPKMATPYRRVAGEYLHADFIDPSVTWSAGGMYSTVGDLLRWTTALHGGEVFRSPRTLSLMLHPHIGGYGYGLDVKPVEVAGRAIPAAGHEGGINGFGTMLRYFPEDDRVVIAADNTQRNVVAVTGALTAMLYGESVPLPAEPIDDVLRRVIGEGGTQAAVERYRDLREDPDGRYDFAEFRLNRLGYEYLLGGDVDAAIRIFELNTEAYPEAFNTWDSLGEALLLAGRTEEGLEMYQRSLDLNPENQNARRVLEENGVEPGRQRR